jgi:hypothetical protein
MRLFMDTVVALMLVALLGGVIWHNRADQSIKQDRDLARSEVHRFQQQIALQSALAKVQRNERGYPETVDPNWFQGVLPANPLIDIGHPWLEIAGPDQKDLVHPQDRVATDKNTAKFWYNPHTGVVRARVPAGVSDAAALELYNHINECYLPELFADGATAPQ